MICTQMREVSKARKRDSVVAGVCVRSISKKYISLKLSQKRYSKNAQGNSVSDWPIETALKMKKPRVNEMVNETNLSPEIGFQHVRELLRSFGPIRPSRQIQSHLVLNKVPENYKLSA